MRIRSASDAVATFIAWLPFLVVVVAVGWVLCSGMAGLERMSFGTELFSKNSETTNLPPWATQSSETDRLQAALDSGDTARMSRELDRVSG